VAGIRSADAETRLQAYADLRRYTNENDRAIAQVPELVRAFAGEGRVLARNALATLIVRFAATAVDAPSLVEQLGKQLRSAKTKDDRFAALVAMRLAAEKGWDLTSVVPVVGQYPFEGWAAEALQILTLAADRGVDVLSPVAEGGFEIWEAVRHVLELPDAALRRAAVRLLTVAARRRLPHLSYFTVYIGLRCVSSGLGEIRVDNVLLRTD